jgi:hypothetical protein
MYAERAAQCGRGRRSWSRPARAAAGLHGPKADKREKLPFFFFSQHFKAFSNEILKFYLSFQMEHTIQNIM